MPLPLYRAIHGLDILPALKREAFSSILRNTYYGQRFIYRLNRASASGLVPEVLHKSPTEQMFVLTVPKLPLGGLPKHDPTAYPSLQRVFETIEVGSTSVTSIRESTLLPIVIAHDEASTPMKTGSKVLILFERGELDF